jgi:hypothetical protein
MVGFLSSGIPAAIVTETICRLHLDPRHKLFKPDGLVNSEIDLEHRSILMTG